MALHAAAMMAFFVDQVAQAPVVVQCAQAPPESWAKWLLPTIVQMVVSLLSIFAGVGIAVRSFRANKKSEHEQWIRNQEAGHEQWLRDQEKAEWSAILSSLTAADVKLPHVFDNVEWASMSDGMLEDLRNVLPTMRNAIFVSDALEQGNATESFRNFVSEAAEKIKQIKDFTINIDGMTSTSALIGSLDGPELIALNRLRFQQIADREGAYNDHYLGFHEQANKIRKTAIEALYSTERIIGQPPSIDSRASADQ
ncbi:MAG: hypothetical protein P4L51_24915 [Puia sp.]|nr:hypothetical protein [Puia sp.]